MAVPKHFQTVNAVVLSPTPEAIKAVIVAAGWLSGYTMKAYWISSAFAEF